MLFTAISRSDLRGKEAKNACFLVNDNWDDFGYKTLYQLVYVDKQGARTEIGGTKIMFRDQTAGRVELTKPFKKLPATYVSLGQEQSFYETLLSLGDEICQSILEALRDVAWNGALFQAFEHQPAMQTSLMRGIRRIDVGKFSDLVHKREVLTPYHFTYKYAPSTGAVGSESISLTFKVEPHTLPPTNIHTIIGSNGVGKTTLLKSIITLLCDGESADPALGKIVFRTKATDHSEHDGTFANLVHVAFSAFDEIEFPSSQNGTSSGIRLSYIGLRKPSKRSLIRIEKDGTKRRTEPESESQPTTQLKTIAQLTTEFVRSALVCLRSSRKSRWASAMQVLESDPVFSSRQLSRLADFAPETLETKLRNFFRDSSSGHKIVLLSLTRMVELVDERTLVIIDEPEAHLHPPLQSAFVRALSALLIERNAVALLATHSPVMLQEVSQDCVWLLFRTGDVQTAERPEIETFGENVGALTSEVFRLEVNNSGFHTLLKEAVEHSDSYDNLLKVFRGRVGAEGRAIARSLWRSANK